MNDSRKTQEELISELTILRQRVAELEAQRDEAEQSANDQRFHSEILQNMSEGVYLIRVSDGLFVFTNPIFEQMFGYESGELIGKHVSMINAPTDQDPMKTATEIMQILNKTGIWQGEVHTIRKDGSVFWCRVTISSFHHEKFGDVWISVQQDITEQKLAETTLQQEQERAQQYLDAAEALMVAVNTYEETTLINQKGCEVLGYTEEELLGKNWFDTCLPERYREDVRAYFHQLIRDETHNIPGHENLILTKSGEERIIEWHNTIIKDDHHNMIGLLSSGQDVTERKQAEDRRDSLAQIVENSLNEIYIFDAETMLFIEVNRGARDNLGYTLDELSKMTPIDIKPEYTHEAFTDLTHPLHTGEQKTLEFTTVHQRKDGSRYPVNVYLQLTTYQSSKVFVAIVLDITARKQAEEQLRKLSRAVEQSANTIIITDTDGNIEYVNPYFTQVTGYTFEEVVGKNPKILKSGHTSPDEYEQLWDTIKSGEEWRGEFHNKKKSGELYWERASISPIRDENGSITHYLAVKEDITERKQAEDALATERYLLNTVLENLPVDVFVKDRDSRFMFMNAATMCTRRVKKPEDYMGKTDFDFLFQPGQAAKNFAIEQKVMETGEPILNQEYDRSGADGKQKWGLSSKLPLRDAQGNITGLVGFNLDITKQKQAEILALENEHLKTQFQKEQEQSVLIQRIISTLSHDIRTPLSVISMSRDMLARYCDRLTKEKRQEKLDTIEHQIQFALQLLDDTVQMARGRHEFHPALINLASLCQISLDEIHMAENTTHQLRFDNLDEIETAFIDETLVSRILLNLLSNAIKYSPDGGEIRLELNRHDDWVILRVIDQGMGISSDDLPHIFDLLYRSDGVQDILGTGLGLSIVKDCVERHQGDIIVQSELGRGSIFTVKLPL